MVVEKQGETLTFSIFHAKYVHQDTSMSIKPFCKGDENSPYQGSNSCFPVESSTQANLGLASSRYIFQGGHAFLRIVSVRTEQNLPTFLLMEKPF